LNFTNSYSQIKNNSFVAVINFQPIKYYYDSDNNGKIDGDDKYYFLPAFSSLSGLYPVAFINEVNS